ncbi:MAG: amidohydrolase family protein [Gudongella sp.]|nr:amidohydrolase family protein [Gudongella sp.]
MTKKTVYKGFTLIDGTGKAPLENAYLLVEDKKIKEVGSYSDLKTSDECVVVDLNGKIVMPGMINSHVHIVMEPIGDPNSLLMSESKYKTTLRGVANLKKHLNSGVTFFRDMGGLDFIDIELRDAVNSGLIEGPQFLASGKVVTMTGGHGWAMGRESDGPEETRKAAREQLKAGADIVKIMATGGVMTKGVEPGSPQLTMEEMKPAVDEAHKSGKKTASHAQGTVGIKNAIRAGIDSIEHGIFLDDESISMMLENGTYLVPTLAAPYFIVKYGVANGVPDFIVKKAESVMDSHIASFKQAFKAGVKIAMGTDSGTPFNQHDGSYYELMLFVENGMTPMEAIVTSTKNSAECLGIEKEYGTLEKDKFADFIVLDENPLDKLDTLLDVKEVYKLGKKVK